jgi:hypothetical protein
LEKISSSCHNFKRKNLKRSSHLIARQIWIKGKTQIWQPKYEYLSFASLCTSKIMNSYFICLFIFSYIFNISSLGLHIAKHTTRDDQDHFFFLCFHIVFNNSSLIMSMSNLIWFNINFIAHEKTHVNLFFHIHVGGYKKREWDNY